jgi:hypothetical protein
MEKEIQVAWERANESQKKSLKHGGKKSEETQ